ncbi:hypothetical protein CVS40_11966 [Lucilia cuprina]|nr:hypothetical protein CVS40_11966 [Lucilia cuprina]
MHYINTANLVFKQLTNKIKDNCISFKSENLKIIEMHYGDEDVEIVNSYKYLGVDINFNLSFNNHLKNKLQLPNWLLILRAKYINNPKISKNNKLKVFQSASRSIMFYAAQIWAIPNMI